MKAVEVVEVVDRLRAWAEPRTVLLEPQFQESPMVAAAEKAVEEQPKAGLEWQDHPYE